MSTAAPVPRTAWIKPALALGAVLGFGAAMAEIASLPDVVSHPATARVERIIAALRYS